MKTYIKPELQVREIRVMENLAKITPAQDKLNWVLGQAPTTVYSLGLYSASGGGPVVPANEEEKQA